MWPKQSKNIISMLKIQAAILRDYKHAFFSTVFRHGFLKFQHENKRNLK